MLSVRHSVFPRRTTTRNLQTDRIRKVQERRADLPLTVVTPVMLAPLMALATTDSPPFFRCASLNKGDHTQHTELKRETHKYGIGPAIIRGAF